MTHYQFDARDFGVRANAGRIRARRAEAEWLRPMQRALALAEGLKSMMVAVFATMSLALICGWIGRRWLAVTLFATCLVLTIGLFRFEVYSPEYGFRMPWLQTNFGSSPMALLAPGSYSGAANG